MGAAECARMAVYLFFSADWREDDSRTLGMAIGPAGSRSVEAAAHNWTAGSLRRRVWSSFHAAQEVDDVGTKAGQRDFFDAPAMAAGADCWPHAVE